MFSRCLPALFRQRSLRRTDADAPIATTQLIAETPRGLTVASEYARRQGISVEAHIVERYGKNMTTRAYGQRVVEWLLGPQTGGIAFGVSEGGVHPIDEPQRQRS